MTFAERYGPWAVVLGASEGLGASFAHGLAARGLDVVIAARRSEPLHAVAYDVTARHGVESRPVPLDLARPDFLADLRVVTDELDVGFVVYNGASGYVGPMAQQSVESLHSIVAVNCTGPLLTCEHFGTRMLERGQGGIVVMGSAAGLAGAAYNSAYAASKAFDMVLGESLWAEWRDQGVDVLSVIGPAMDTPNFRAMNADHDDHFAAPMPTDDVVEEVLDAIGSTPSFVPGEAVRNGLAALGALPRRQQVETLSAAHARFADSNRTI